MDAGGSSRRHSGHDEVPRERAADGPMPAACERGLRSSQTDRSHRSPHTLACAQVYELGSSRGWSLGNALNAGSALTVTCRWSKCPPIQAGRCPNSLNSTVPSVGRRDHVPAAEDGNGCPGIGGVLMVAASCSPGARTRCGKSPWRVPSGRDSQTAANLRALVRSAGARRGARPGRRRSWRCRRTSRRTGARC